MTAIGRIWKPGHFGRYSSTATPCLSEDGGISGDEYADIQTLHTRHEQKSTSWIYIYRPFDSYSCFYDKSLTHSTKVTHRHQDSESLIMPEYTYTGTIDCEVQIDSSRVKGKTAVVTGGASGIGEAYSRALVAAGVNVVVGDLDSVRGEKLESELSRFKFVKCDTTKWDDQLHLFKEAAAFSADGKISYVVANAGIIRQDEVFVQDSTTDEPKEPDLKTIDVNIKGTLFTAKLAAHYFMKQNGTTPSPEQEDTCLVLIGSGAAFLDCLRIPQYSASKWAARGIMHALRRTAFYYGSRVNVISPWYVKTSILSQKDWDGVSAVGVQFAELEDAGKCLLRILSDPQVNGHSLFLAARKWAASGFVDLDLDDYKDPLLREIQEDQTKAAPVSLGLYG